MMIIVIPPHYGALVRWGHAHDHHNVMLDIMLFLLNLSLFPHLLKVFKKTQEQPVDRHLPRLRYSQYIVTSAASLQNWW